MHMKITYWIVVFFALFSVTAFSQAEQAGIAGTVRDKQGGAIPNAVVEVRQQETMLGRSARTSESGTYFIEGLPIGNYSIQISHPEFTQVLTKDVRLFVGEIRTLDATLEVAGRAERVV